MTYISSVKGCLPQHLNKILCDGKMPKCESHQPWSLGPQAPTGAKLCLYGKKQIINVLTKPAYHTYTNQTFP